MANSDIYVIQFALLSSLSERQDAYLSTPCTHASHKATPLPPVISAIPHNGQACNAIRATAGIPKFYRWLSERYPLVNQPIAETNVPVVDNLYLDMNGIIHNCTHGNDPGRKITEQEMIVKVFGYLEKLFQIVQPQKLLFMAIDGVSPPAAILIPCSDLTNIHSCMHCFFMC